MVLQSRGPLCSCGRRGCAEALIGFRALLTRDQTLAQLTEAVDAAEPTALWRLQDAGRHLGILLNNLWVAFDPVRIIVGRPAMRLGPTLLRTCPAGAACPRKQRPADAPDGASLVPRRRRRGDGRGGLCPLPPDTPDGLGSPSLAWARPPPFPHPHSTTA